MSFGGDIDTLNLLFDKLQNLLNDTQGYYESFLDTNTSYKQGKLSEKEFFEKLGDYVVAYSALEFLSVKVIFELKKLLDKFAQGQVSVATNNTVSNRMGFENIPTTQVTAATLPGSGRPPSIISAATAFSTPGVLPTPDPNLLPKEMPGGNSICNSCGSQVKTSSKFCTKCGNKIQ